MLQVTRVVIRGLQSNGAPGRARLELCQDFGNVLALRRERSGFRCVRRIVAKQVPVSLHRRPAAGSIDDNRIGVGDVECVDELSCGRHGVGFLAGVFRERPAARLPLRDDHFAAFSRQYASRCFVDVPEEHPLHAPEQQRDAFALRALSRNPCRQVGAAKGDRRQQALHRLQTLREKREDAGGMHQPLDAELLIQAERHRQRTQASGVRKHREDQPPECPVPDAAFRIAFDLRAGRFEQRVVLHARRTGGDAGHTAKARIDVANEPGAVGLAAVAPQFHQVDAATR